MLKLPCRALLIASVVALAACSSSPSKTPAGVKSEHEYYQSAQKSMKAGNFSSAVEHLESLESNYPVGRYTEQAQLELIYARYRHGNFGGAASAADRFIRLYPAHPQVDYAYYLRGLANAQSEGDMFSRLLPTNNSHRDLSPAREAFANFRDFVARFPNSPYAADARQRMVHIRNQLAESEMHSARYYVRRGATVAALNRARWVFDNYQGAPVVPEALATIVWAQNKLNMKDLADANLAVLKANYPDYVKYDRKGNFKIDVGSQNERRSRLNMATFGLIGSDGSDN